MPACVCEAERLGEQVQDDGETSRTRGSRGAVGCGAFETANGGEEQRRWIQSGMRPR